MADSDEHPVLTGLLALIGVGLVVGLVLGGAALAATQVLGLGDDDTGGEATSGASMYLPEPKSTAPPSEPLITLEPGETAEESPSESPTKSEKPDEGITLQAGQTEVSPMEQIDLTGVYPGGEGAILQVERFAGGRWSEFPVTASVRGETFTTYVQTGQLGVNRFRMRDTETGEVSNEVRVRIG